MSTERLLVHKDISTAFAAELTIAIDALFPTSKDAPVLINAAGVAKNKRMMEDAVSKGAEVICGDPKASESTDTRMRPIVIKGVTPAMEIYYTESFGPSVSFIEIETEEEALRIANDTDYGLTSAVFTNDLRTGLRFAKGIESGAVHINGMTVS